MSLVKNPLFHRTKHPSPAGASHSLVAVLFSLSISPPTNRLSWKAARLSPSPIATPSAAAWNSTSRLTRKPGLSIRRAGRHGGGTGAGRRDRTPEYASCARCAAVAMRRLLDMAGRVLHHAARILSASRQHREFMVQARAHAPAKRRASNTTAQTTKYS
jgi:hypothetical protein